MFQDSLHQLQDYLVTRADRLFQVFSKVGAVKSCSISKKKNKAGISHESSVREKQL